MGKAETRRIIISERAKIDERMPNNKGRIVTLAPKMRAPSVSDCIDPEMRSKIEGMIKGQEVRAGRKIFSARDAHSMIATLMEQSGVAGDIRDISYKATGYLMDNYDIQIIIKASSWLLDSMRAGYSLDRTKEHLYDVILSSGSIDGDLIALEIIIVKILLGEMSIPVSYGGTWAKATA
jgi:hypothetical protein